MGNILDDLSGGKFSLTGANKKQNKYSVFIQFDNDEPKELFNNINIGDKFTLSLSGPGPDSVMTFTDTQTGKQFKLFAK